MRMGNRLHTGRITARGGASVPLENQTGMEKGAVIETGTGVKIVAIEMWMWTVKEIEETGIGTETGRGTVSVIAAVIGKDVVVSIAIEIGGTGIGLDLILEDDRGTTLDPDLVQDLRLDQEGKQVVLTWLLPVQLLFLVL
jgi:hypothetical protein